MTLALGILGSLVVLLVKPSKGLIVFYASMIWYPTANTFQIATLDFSVTRFVCCVLFIKVMTNQELMHGFKISALDKFMAAYFIGQIVAGTFTTDFELLVINRSGFFFDVFMPFLIIRVLIVDSDSLNQFLKSILFVTAPLALMAIAESVLDRNFLLFGRAEPFIYPRWGMKRAMTTFSNPIYSGVFMSVIFGLGMSIWPKLPKVPGKLFVITVLLGSLCCFSGGAWTSVFAMAGILSLYKYRRSWRQILWVCFAFCLILEVVSNRHFYSVIDRFAFSSQTAWYRTRLMEVALFEGGMKGHWLFGYGYDVDPMWCTDVDGRKHTDIVNHYLLILSQFGLLGFVPFSCLIWKSLKNVFVGLPSIKNNTIAWQHWCFGSTLLGVFFAINSVSLFGSPVSMLFMLFALTACLPVSKNSQMQLACLS